MASKKVPLYQAIIKLSPRDPECVSANSFMYITDKYAHPFAPKQVKDKPFVDVMQEFYNHKNRLTSTIPNIGKVDFSVDHIKYGTLTDEINEKEILTMPFEEFMNNGMPEHMIKTVEKVDNPYTSSLTNRLKKERTRLELERLKIESIQK